jgi:spermidine synthase
MEGVGGFEFYRIKGRLPVTGLQQRGDDGRWHTWMVDDPLHLDGMREAVADLPDGRILVAGLGLGLMLHHMAAQPRFTAITVVELNADVIALVRPTLPVDPRVTIVEGDYYAYIHTASCADWPRVTTFDGVLWDLAVGKPEQAAPEMFRGEVLTAIELPGIPLVQFGYRRQKRPNTMGPVVEHMLEGTDGT